MYGKQSTSFLSRKSKWAISPRFFTSKQNASFLQNLTFFQKNRVFFISSALSSRAECQKNRPLVSDGLQIRKISNFHLLLLKFWRKSDFFWKIRRIYLVFWIAATSFLQKNPHFLTKNALFSNFFRKNLVLMAISFIFKKNVFFRVTNLWFFRKFCILPPCLCFLIWKFFKKNPIFCKKRVQKPEKYGSNKIIW